MLPTLLTLCLFLTSTPVLGRQRSFPIDGPPYGLLAADFNRDGRMDLVVGGTTVFGDAFPRLGAYYLAIYLAGPEDTYSLRARNTLDYPAGAMAAADINGNGLPDLVTPTRAWLDAGAVGFAGERALPHPEERGIPYAVATGDFDANGVDDVVVADVAARRVNVITNGLSGLTLSTSVSLPHNPESVVAADFDGDGLPDIATLGSDGSLVTLYSQRPFEFRVSPSVKGGIAFREAFTADFSGDGHADIAVLDIVNKSAVLFVNTGTSMRRAVELVGRDWVNTIAVGDVTGDRKPEVMLGDWYGRDVTTFEVEPSMERFTRAFGLDLARRGSPLVVADMDGDSVHDLVMADRTGARIAIVYGPLAPSPVIRRRATRR